MAFRLFDIFRLGAFIAATKKQHDPQSDLAKIHAIAWAIVYAEFLHALTYTVTVTKISKAESIQSYSNPCPRFYILQRCEPFTKRRSAILCQIDLEFSGRRLHKPKCSL